MAQGNDVPMDFLEYIRPRRPQRPTLMPHAWTGDDGSDFLAAQRDYVRDAHPSSPPAYTNGFAPAFPQQQTREEHFQDSRPKTGEQSAKEVLSRVTQVIDLTVDDESSTPVPEKRVIGRYGAKKDGSSDNQSATASDKALKPEGRKRARDEDGSEDDNIPITAQPVRPAKRVRPARAKTHQAGAESSSRPSSSKASVLSREANKPTPSLGTLIGQVASDEVSGFEPAASGSPIDRSPSSQKYGNSKKRSHSASIGPQSDALHDSPAPHKRPRLNETQAKPVHGPPEEAIEEARLSIDINRTSGEAVDNTKEDRTSGFKAGTSDIETLNNVDTGTTHSTRRTEEDVGLAAELKTTSRKRKHIVESSGSEFEPEQRSKRRKTKGRPTKTANKPRKTRKQKGQSSDLETKNNEGVRAIPKVVRSEKKRRFDYFNRHVERAFPPPVNEYIDFEDISDGPVKEYLLRVNNGSEITVPIHDQYYRAIADLVLDAAKGNIERAWFMGDFVATFVNDRNLIDQREGGHQHATYKALKCLRRAEWSTEIAKIYWGTCDYMPLLDPVKDQEYEEFKENLAAQEQAGKIIASEYWLCKKESGEPMPDLRMIDEDVWSVVAAWPYTDHEDWGEGASMLTFASLGQRTWESD